MTLAMTLDMTLAMTGEAPETAQEPSKLRVLHPRVLEPPAEQVLALWNWLDNDRYEITAPRED